MRKEKILWLILVILLLTYAITQSISIESSGSMTTISVEPPISKAAPGETFNVDITVTNVTDLYGWNVLLRFSSTIFNATSLTRGHFLEMPGYWTNWQIKEMMGQPYGVINNTMGYIIIGDTFMPPFPSSGVTGNGTLLTITFLVKAEGATSLSFDKEQTKLTTIVDATKLSIPHETVDGFFDNRLPRVHDVAILGVTASPSVVMLGDLVSIDVTVANEGNSTENVIVTVSYDSTDINTTTFALDEGASEQVLFNWDTTTVLPGSYAITAEAILAGDIEDANPNDNLASTSVLVEMPLGTIVGTVTDASTVDPIEGASVTANGYSDITDTQGLYSIEVSPGTYNVTVSALGYVSSTIEVTVSADETVTVDFALELIIVFGWINGTVTDADSALPVAGASIIADGYSATTDEFGYYEMEVEPGTYTVTAEADGYHSESILNVAVTAGETTTVDVELTPFAPPMASFVYEPFTPYVGDIVTFNASASIDPDGTIVSYAWDFGDGPSDTGMIATHVYLTEGTYTVTLTITDNDGLTDTATADITISPPPIHDIAILDVTASPTIVMLGDLVSIGVTVANEGDFIETFDVTIYCDSMMVDMRTVTDLAPGAETTLTFIWDTTGMEEGAYTIKAEASVVVNEIDTDDNTFIDDTVTITTLVAISATVDLDPNTLNLKSKGKWISCYIKLPEGYNVENINVSSVQIDGYLTAEWGKVEGNILMVKFDRQAVIEYIRDVLEITNGKVTLTITGNLYNGTTFEGNDTINVISKGQSKSVISVKPL